MTVLADAVGLRDLGERESLCDRGQDATPGDVERNVDTVGRERANRLDEAVAVRDGLGPQRAKVLVVRRAGGADHAHTARHGELNRGAADAAGGAVDEQRAAAPDAELVERARGRLDGRRQRGSVGEVERRRIGA